MHLINESYVNFLVESRKKTLSKVTSPISVFFEWYFGDEPTAEDWEDLAGDPEEFESPREAKKYASLENIYKQYGDSEAEFTTYDDGVSPHNMVSFSFKGVKYELGCQDGVFKGNSERE